MDYKVCKMIIFSKFIAGDYIKKKTCDDLIKFFDKSNNKEPGNVYKEKGEKVVDKKVKDSIDLTIFNDEDVAVQNYLDQLKIVCNKYKKKYTYSDKHQNPWGVVEPINIQKYKKNGGFKVFHSEKDGSPITSKRHLVFMTYLNDVEDGGTEFLHYGIKTKAQKGLTLIWPTDFTHQHRGIVSHTKEKYIVTGWYNFIDDQSNK